MSRAQRKLRVCVIGAGAAGLCALRHLASDPSTFEPTAYEQMTQLGGTWLYNENVGEDAHSSMYENLRTNLPGAIMNFPDWPKMGSRCITHTEVLSYLQDYANHFDLHKYITFNSRIELVEAVDQTNIASLSPSLLATTIWKVKIKNMDNHTIEEKEFDAVICCNGHLSRGYIPSIPGIETFPGQVLHSHDYRKPQTFAGKTVVILGASSSGLDIGIELAGYASQVYLSHDKPRITAPLPGNLTQVMGVTRAEGNRLFLKDGTSVLADAFVYCTGYNYSFPFLDKSCGIAVEDKYVYPLYKHLINVEHPTMCLIGIPSRTIIPFPLFHIQVQYFIALLKGHMSLPSKEIMLDDSRLKITSRKYAHHFTKNEQQDYCNTLTNDGHFEPLPALYQVSHNAWNVHIEQDPWHYKQARLLVGDDDQSVQIIPDANDTSL